MNFPRAFLSSMIFFMFFAILRSWFFENPISAFWKAAFNLELVKLFFSFFHFFIGIFIVYDIFLLFLGWKLMHSELWLMQHSSHTFLLHFTHLKKPKYSISAKYPQSKHFFFISISTSKHPYTLKTWCLFPTSFLQASCAVFCHACHQALFHQSMKIFSILPCYLGKIYANHIYQQSLPIFPYWKCPCKAYQLHVGKNYIWKICRMNALSYPLFLTIMPAHEMPS